MNTQKELEATVASLVQPGKGILAADESLPTIAKRFAPFSIDNTEENRRAYRSLLCTATGVEAFISGVILFEETLGQRTDDGTPLPEVLARRGIVPGIKVDKGTVPLANAAGDLVTVGLDGLPERLKGYKAQGARFAKWREVYGISAQNPTPLGIAANAEVLAAYAAICQAEGIVPIVEPEVLIDGDHTMARCEDVTEAVLHAVFDALHRHKVILEGMILKPSMVVPGKSLPKATPVEVATATIRLLRRTVPAAVAGICFLSGGQGPEEASANLSAMNAQFPHAPWLVSFSFGRALQDPVIEAWAGRPQNVAAAQRAFLHRARMNGLARIGKWNRASETAA